MHFYVYEYPVGSRVRKAVVHRSSCSWCKGGIGVHEQRGGENGRWSEPFDTIRDALDAAQQTGGRPRLCERCCPDYKSRYLYLAENWQLIDEAMDLILTTPYYKDLDPSLDEMTDVLIDIEEEMEQIEPYLRITDPNLLIAEGEKT